MSLRAFGIGLALFATTAGPIAPCALAAQAASPNRLFTDSRMVQRDRISVEVVGSGPDVVLIPGLASSREVWRRTAERLRGRYRLHLVQVAGFAGEPAGPNASGPVLAPTVAAIDAYIASAGLTKPAVVGHSLGGVMALQLAADHPDHVGRAMVVDALAFYTELFAGPQATVAGAQPYADQIGKQMLAASDADYAVGAAKTATMMATAPADQARIQRWSTTSTRATMVRAMQEDMTTDLRPRIASITVPITVVYEAALGPLVTTDYAALAHKTLIPATAGARHFLMYDDPAGFDAALDRFLAG